MNYFLESKGKDISFERWRISIYYNPGFALTALFKSEELYQDFKACYWYGAPTWEEFLTHFKDPDAPDFGPRGLNEDDQKTRKYFCKILPIWDANC